MIAVLGVTAITPNPGRSFLTWLASMDPLHGLMASFLLHAA